MADPYSQSYILPVEAFRVWKLMTYLKPIQPVRISRHVYEAIETAIVHCELRPGSVLSDRHLAETLGVSRTPVRDALHQLESTGIVVSRGRSGWMVAGFEGRDVRELFEVRCVLEPLGLEHLARTWDEAVVRDLSTLFDDFPQPLPRPQYMSYLARDNQFHKRIVACSENSRVTHFYNLVEKQIDRGRHFLATGYEGRIDDVAKEHRRICAAIAARDLECATAALLDHLCTGEEKMIVFARELGHTQRTAERGAQ